MKNFTFLFIFFFVSNSSLAQMLTLQWQQLAGGNATSSTKFNAIKPTTDGGFIAVGHAAGNFAAGDSSYIKGYHYSGFGATDGWVVKFSSAGQIQWGRCFGGSYNDDALGVCLSGDGGYIISGYAQSTDGDLAGVSTLNNTVWVFKIDGSGNLQWSKNLFSTNTGDESSNAGNDIIATQDGEYIVCGSAFNAPFSKGSVDALLWKLDVNGNTVWTKTYGGTAIDYGSHVIQMPDQGYILTASAASGDGDLTGDDNTTTDTHFWLVRTDSSGNILWQKVPDPALPSQETIHDFIKCTDGSYALTGADQADVNGTIYYDAIFLMHTDSSGNMLWEKNYGNYQSASGSSGVGWGIVQSADGNFIIDGQTLQSDTSFHSQCYGGFIMKIAPGTGDLIAYQGFPGVAYNINSQHDNNGFLFGITKDLSGTIALCGQYGSGTSGFLDSIITAHSWDVSGSSGYVLTLNDMSGTLPVALLTFTATLVNAQTRLQWSTAREINSLYFSVMRSCDGINFGEIANVPCHDYGNTPDTYTATDTSPLNGANYYQLKEVDIDGKAIYSPVVYVIAIGADFYKVYPNPVKEVINIEVPFTDNRQVVIQLFDISGKLSASETARLTAGKNIIEWRLPSLARGIYFARISNTDAPILKIFKE